VAARRLPVRPAETGEIFAALAMAHRLKGQPFALAFHLAVAGVLHALARTHRGAWPEMPISGELKHIILA